MKMGRVLVLLLFSLVMVSTSYGQKRNGKRINIDDYQIILFDDFENVVIKIENYKKAYHSFSNDFIALANLISNKIKYGNRDVFQVFFYKTQKGNIEVLVNHIERALAKREKRELEYIFYSCIGNCQGKSNLYTLYKMDLQTSQVKELSNR